VLLIRADDLEAEGKAALSKSGRQRQHGCAKSPRRTEFRIPVRLGGKYSNAVSVFPV
jgi:hypothetical protein